MEKQIVTLHIRVSERVAAALKKLAASDHRKLSPYIGIVLERHVDAAASEGGAKPERGTRKKG
jgi:mRNA-degrading endonuclease RelE of RelBE toxin-antitoxin system